jgi:nucleotide-binding universal stress UspA family protein
MCRQQEREIPFEEAVSHWYDEVYIPVVRVIREQGILQEFPARTETDLYVWISKHRDEIEKELGWEVRTEAAVDDLVTQFSTRPRRIAARIKERVLDAALPEVLEAGPPPGHWQRGHITTHHDEHLFSDMLVPVNGREGGWYAFEQAVEVARREGGRLHGLHVVSSPEQTGSKAVLAVQAEFNQRCRAANIPGELVIEAGKVERKICERARWTDLVVLKVAHPPTPQPISRLSSGLSTLIRRCPRPVLAVPGAASELRQALLAYDNSPKAKEALFAATYLAGQWNIPLTVVSVLEDKRVTSETPTYAQQHLEAHKIQAVYVEENGSVAEAILKTATAHKSDLIVTGGYGFSPILEIALGSTVDQLLRESRKPVLICR